MSNDASMVMELLNCPEEERASRARAFGASEQTLRSLIEETTQLTMSNARTGVDAAAIVVRLADEFGSPLLQAQSRRAQVRAMSYAGLYDEALLAAQRGIEIAQEADLIEEAGRIRLATMHALTEAGRLDQALHDGQIARALFQSIGKVSLAGRADVNLGIVHQRRDEPEEAVACFSRAAPALQDEPVALGHLENSRGEALYALNDFVGAERAFAAALDAFEQAGTEMTAAIAQGNRADLAMRQGRLPEALALFEQTRRRFESIGSPGHLARVIAEQAETRYLIGMNEEALHDYQRALQQLDECGLPLEAARARSGMGQVMIRLGRYSEAETALAAAATGFAELDHQTAQARVNLHRAELAAAGGRVREARELALRSLSVLHARPIDALAARRVLASLALQAGDVDAAEHELAQAIATAERYELMPLIADLLVLQGEVHRHRGETEEQLASWRAAIAAIERVRSSFQAIRFRTAFLGEHAETYGRLVEALLARGGNDYRVEAFNVAERCKCRSLAEADSAAFAADGPAGASDSASPGQAVLGDDAATAALRAQQQRLHAELNGLYSRLADDRSERLTTDAYDALLGQVRSREQQLRECDLRLDALDAAATLDRAPVTVEEVQEALDADEALLEYFAAAQSLFAFVVTRHSLHVVTLPSHSDVDGTLRRLQFQMDRALRPGVMPGDRSSRLLHDAHRELAVLHEQLIQPIDSHLAGADRLTIVPHGSLHGVPFAALFDGHEYLIDRHVVRTAPNASLAIRAGATHHHAVSDGPDSPRMARALIVAVGDEYVPHIEDEAHDVADALRAALPDLELEMLLGREATADGTLARMGEADLLHFACHGEFSASPLHGSGLKLADRWLTARDLAAHQLRARLVVLSACESGHSAVEAGDELAGLLRAFLGAGAASLLVSQWRAHDESSRKFMRILYDRCQNRMMATGALEQAVRQSQLDLRDEYPHPAFWACFQLTGGER